MQFLVKVSFPVEAANAAAKKNGLSVIRQILDRQKPEAAYLHRRWWSAHRYPHHRYRQRFGHSGDR